MSRQSMNKETRSPGDGLAVVGIPLYGVCGVKVALEAVDLPETGQYRPDTPNDSSVAQLAERRPVKPIVAGSSPARGATEVFLVV